MRNECITAVAAAYGREPTEAEIRNIEQSLGRVMRETAARDAQAWLGMSRDEQVAAGAAGAAREIMEEAELRERRTAMQILAISRLQTAMREMPGVNQLDALSRIIAFSADTRSNVQSLETRGEAIRNDALRQMLGTLEATNPGFFGMIENPEGVRDLVRELHGEGSGNATAKNGAELFRRIAEVLRQRFNRAGGAIGKRDDWGMPHHHSQVRVARAGRDAWLQSLGAGERAKAILMDRPPPPDFARSYWVSKILPALDRLQYLREDGTRMGDGEVAELLGRVWTTIATGGANTLSAGQRGRAAASNYGSESRQLHFKSADAYMDYQSSFGERSVYDVLVGHIHALSDEIAAVETFGPNPDHVFRLLKDQAYSQLATSDPGRLGKLQSKAVQVENLFNAATGRTLPIANARMARWSDNLRSHLVSSRLGSAVITSITDEGTMMRMAQVNNLPQLQLWRNELAAFNPTNQEEKRLAMRAGLALNTLVGSLNRFGNEGLGSSWSSKLATATLRASGLNAATEARRRAFGVTYMSALGDVVKSTARLADLDQVDHRVLLSKGISETDFAVWKRAEQEDWGSGNDSMLTPDSIYRIPDDALADLGDPDSLRMEAATKLLGAALEETNMAVIEPGLRERAMMGANLQRGTLKGEVMRSVFLFKSFPLAMITKHWSRALSEPTQYRRSKALLALTTSSTLLGMVALQAAALKDGKDPRDMTDSRTWMAALLKGGALSIFGDFLFAKETEQGRGAIATLLGPVAGLTEEALALTWGNAIEASKGEETNVGAEAVRFAKNNTPGLSALMNLWYTRAAFDHLLLHDLQESVSPGYLQRMENRTEDEYGQSYWWAPGGSPFLDASGQDFAPERAPDLEAAIGSGR